MAYNTPGGEKRIAIERPVWTIDEVAKANRVLMETPHALKFLENKRNIKETMISKFGIGFVNRLQALTIPVYDLNGQLFNIRFHSIRSKKKWGIAGKTTLMLYDTRVVDWAKEEIWIVEGEGDLWAAVNMGLNALTTTSGAPSMHVVLNDHKDKFKGKKIILALDKDLAGREATSRVRALFDSSSDVSIVKWPQDAPQGYDLSDWAVGVGKTLSDPIEALRSMTRPYTLSEAMDEIRIADECLSDVEGNDIYTNGYEYWKRAAKGMSRRLSTFVFKPRMRLIQNGQEPQTETLVVDIMCGQNVFDGVFVPKESFSSRKLFLKNLPSAELSFRGNEIDLQDLMEFVAGNKRRIKTRHAVSYFGIIPEYDAWVSPNCVINRTGFQEDPAVIALPQGTVIEDRIHPVDAGEDKKEEILTELLKLIPEAHAPECSMVIWPWMIACFLKPWFPAYKFGGFPILNIFGTAGGGKTSLASMFYRMFGYNEAEPFSARMTPFSVVKLLSVTTTMPLIVDEFKYDLPQEYIQFWRNRARSVYSGEVDFRGTQEQKLIQYKYRAPLTICGEIALSHEKALIERVIPSSPSPFWLQSDKGIKARAVFEKLKNANLEAFPGYFVPWLLQNRKTILGKGMNEAIAYVRKLTGNKKLPIRIEKNIAVIRLGAQVLREFLEENLTKPDFKVFDETADIALKWVVKELRTTEATGRTKMAIDDMLECWAIMASSGRLQNDIHYCWAPANEGVIKIDNSDITIRRYVYIHFASAFPEFCKWARETNYRGEILDKNAYARQIRECNENGEYIRDVNKNKRFGDQYEGNIRRTIMIDLLKASQMGLEVDGFGVPSGAISACVSERDSEYEEAPELQLPEEYELAPSEQGFGGGEEDIPF